MERKCEHPKHEKYLSEALEDPSIYKVGNETTISGIHTDLFIKTSKYGTICGNCWSIEFGNVLPNLADENGRVPIIPSDDDTLSKYERRNNR